MKIHQWRTSFETGHAGIDSQHRELFASLENLDAFNTEGNTEQAFAECQRFRKLAANHLSFEENVLDDAGFSRLDMHRKTHVEFSGKIEEVFSPCGETCKETRRRSCNEVMSFILVDHLLRNDLDFKSFLQTKKLADGNA